MDITEQLQGKWEGAKVQSPAIKSNSCIIPHITVQ